VTNYLVEVERINSKVVSKDAMSISWLVVKWIGENAAASISTLV